MVLPEQLVRMQRYISNQGRLSPYEARRFRLTLNAYEREAHRSGDVQLEHEVNRLREQVDLMAALPITRTKGKSVRGHVRRRNY